MIDQSIRKLFFVSLFVVGYFFWGITRWLLSGRKKEISYYLSQIRENLFLAGLLIAFLIIFTMMIFGLDDNDLNRITNFNW